jgi:CelD/BcsL family acetyltransferase involved in cellulose biosynthesis
LIVEDILITMAQQMSLSERISFLPITDERWMDYITKNPQANIFHHPAWSQLLAECYGFRSFICVTCDPNGNILAGLPVMKIHSWFLGHRWVSLPFTDHCIPLYEDTSALFCLMDGLLNHAQAQGIRNVEFRGEFLPHPSIQPSRQFAWHKLRLEEDFSRVARRIQTMHQRNAKTALKRGVHVTWGKSPEDLNAFYHLHLEERRRQGVPVQPRQFFELIRTILFGAGLGSILLAYKGEKIIAALLLLKYGQTLTYKYGASDRTCLNLRPNDLLFWTAIQWGCENGFSLFDMGRTDLDNPGLCRFKKGWGADEMPLNYFTMSQKPQKHITGSLMKMMKPVIQKSPRWVCQYAGELLYKYFG